MSEEHTNEENVVEKKEENHDNEEITLEETPSQDTPVSDENIDEIESIDQIENESPHEEVNPEDKITEDISLEEKDPDEISFIEQSNEGSEQDSLQEELSPEDIENIDELLSEVEDNEVKIPQESVDDDDEVKIVSVKELTEKTFKRNTIEAALLAAQRPIGIEEISIKLEMSKAEIEKLIQELAEDYMDRTTAIEIVQIGEGFSMQIKPEYTEKIVKFASGGLIPKAVMRTLTIIAVKQPLLKSLLVKMRGSTAYEHCKFLIDRGYVTAYKKGRSSVLETTDQFADTFGLSRNVESLKKQLIEQLNITSLEEPPGEESMDQVQEITPSEEISEDQPLEQVLEAQEDIGDDSEITETEEPLSDDTPEEQMDKIETKEDLEE